MNKNIEMDSQNPLLIHLNELLDYLLMKSFQQQLVMKLMFQKDHKIVHLMKQDTHDLIKSTVSHKQAEETKRKELT
jgi:hypothetical protein